MPFEAVTALTEAKLAAVSGLRLIASETYASRQVFREPLPVCPAAVKYTLKLCTFLVVKLNPVCIICQCVWHLVKLCVCLVNSAGPCSASSRYTSVSALELKGWVCWVGVLCGPKQNRSRLGVWAQRPFSSLCSRYHMSLEMRWRSTIETGWMHSSSTLLWTGSSLQGGTPSSGYGASTSTKYSFLPCSVMLKQSTHFTQGSCFSMHFSNPMPKTVLTVLVLSCYCSRTHTLHRWSIIQTGLMT